MEHPIVPTPEPIKATCETNGHIFGHEGVCVFCRAPKPNPEPCRATHAATGAVCELPAGHIQNHRGPFAQGIAQWPEPSVTTDPWERHTADLVDPESGAVWLGASVYIADAVDAALTLERQQHRDALAKQQVADVKRLAEIADVQAQEIERLTLKRHDANCELRGPGGAVDRRCSCGFRALRAEMRGQAQEIAELKVVTPVHQHG